MIAIRLNIATFYNLLTCDEYLIYRVPLTLALCISKLKSNKSNGNKGFTSDHLYNWN